MADTKPSSNYYSLLGGINTKVSDYAPNQAAFQDLRNLDFFRPNALQKRPGSTQAVTVGTSGPISSLFEFERLDGASYIVAGSDTAMFYIAAGGLTTLSTGWTNGQPTDMLTFVNRLWMANGQNCESWDAATYGLLPFGLPCVPAQGATYNPLLPSGNLRISNTSSGASFFLLGGATVGFVTTAGITFFARGAFFTYSYLRADGYMGPADLSQARNLVSNNTPASEGDEFFAATFANKLFGFTYPPNCGITAVAVWVGVDSIDRNSPFEFIPEINQNSLVGDLGYLSNPVPTTGNQVYLAPGLKPTADLARFWLYTLVPVSLLFLAPDNRGITGYAMTLSSFRFNQFTGLAPTARAFSGVPFCFFNTFTPKYLEQNNNVMFYSGFSNAPSSIQFSEIGEPEFTQPDYSFEVRTNDGDKVTGMKTYNSTVIVTKERSFAKIMGSTPEDLQLVELSTEFGCISNKSIVEFDQKLAWLDRRGILEFNGSTWQIISTPVEPIFRRMNLSAAREKACSVNHQYRNQVWFGIPIDGSSTNNITVVYDYLVGAWTYFDGFNPSSFALVKGSLGTPSAWRGDYSGKVHYFGESFYGDNGQGITCLGVPNWEVDGGQQSTSLWRRFFLDVAPASGATGVINTRIFSNYDASTVQATFAMYQNQFQSRADFGIGAKAVTAEFSHFSASLPLLINGFSWTKRFLRNV